MITMRRRTFLSRCANLGLVLPLSPSLLWMGCATSNNHAGDLRPRFDGDVIIVGAGAAGLAAGYMLDGFGIEYEIFEASGRFGGRVGKLDGFMDFPIDLGAEWIHTDPSIFTAIVNDAHARVDIDTIEYSPETIAIWNGRRLKSVDWVSALYGEHKFYRSTWYDFLEEWLYPASAERLRLNTPVTSIDASGARVRVALESGRVASADRGILAIPVKMLQQDGIVFEPPLPEAKHDAMDAVTVVDGFKMFAECDERFYPDLTVMRKLREEGAADYLAIDGAFRKDSARHLLTVFCVGKQAERFVHESDARIMALLTEDLDAAFDGAFSRSLLKARVQNWSAQPYIQGAYVDDWRGRLANVVEELAAPIDGKLFWAGSSMSVNNLSTVHGAIESGYAAAHALLEFA